jgi:hypothetical protein
MGVAGTMWRLELVLTSPVELTGFGAPMKGVEGHILSDPTASMPSTRSTNPKGLSILEYPVSRGLFHPLYPGLLPSRDVGHGKADGSSEPVNNTSGQLTFSSVPMHYL